VSRVWAIPSRRSSLASRFIENLTFGVSSMLTVLRGARGVAYLNSWPLFATSLAVLACGIRRMPFVVAVQDLYPESLEAQRRIAPGSWPSRLLLRLDAWAMQRAAAVVCISETHRQAMLRRGISPERLHLIPNWVESSAAAPMDRDAARRRLGIPLNAFLVVYAGNIGVAADVPSVIEALAGLPAHSVSLLVAGEGAELDRVRRAMDEAKHTVPSFLRSPWRADDHDAVLGAADAFVLATRKGQEGPSLPSKVITYLLAGRPVVAQGRDDGELAHILRAAGAGIVVPAGDPVQLREAVEKVRALPSVERHAMGDAGRRFAAAHFSSDACVPRIVALLEGAAAAMDA
jgi:glycosyltransferase involved in cell wall biosynthesis